MKVREKLSAGFLAIIVLMWVSVLFASQTYRSIQNEFAALQEDIIPGALAMAEMAEKIEAVKAWSIVYMIAGNAERGGKTVKEWLQESMQSLETLAKEHGEQSLALIPDEAKTARELEDRIKRINPIIMRLVDMKDQGIELDELMTEREKSLLPLLAPLQTQITEHIAENMVKLVKSEEAVGEAHSTGMLVLLIAAGMAGLVAVVIALLVTRSIVNPLHALHRGTEVIGEGNLDYKVGTKAKDEIGQFSRAFDRMTEGLRGNTVTIEALNKEITERKRAEVALKESQRRFADLANLLPVSVWEADLEGNFTFVNRRGLEWAGVSATEDLSTVAPVNAGEVAIPDDRERQQANSRKIFEGEDIGGVEYTNLRTDGSTYPVQVYAVPVIQDGEPVGLRGVTIDITERKRAEEELRRSEENLRTYLEAAPDAIYINNLNGVLLYGNRKAEQITGYSREELLGNSFLDLGILPPEYLAKAAELLIQNEAGKPTGPDEFELTRKDGCRVWVEISTTPISQGENTVVLGFVRDITERRQREEEVLRLSSVVDSATEAISITDMEGIITDCNQAWVEMTGYEKEETIGKTPVELCMAEEDLPRMMEAIGGLVSGKPVPTSDYVTICKDSTRLTTSVNLSLMKNRQGELYGVAAILRDVTEQRQTEELYQTLTNSSPIGVYIAHNGEFTFANPKFLEYSGYTKEELLGAKSLSLVHPEDRAGVRESAVAMLKGERQTPYEFRVLRKDGHIEWAMETVNSINYNSGKAVIGSFMLVTERRQTEEQLVQKTRELEAVSQAKSEFLASMSHELRTPLNAVIGFSELLIDGIPGEVNDEQKECLEDILTSGRNLLTLISDVLDISKVEAGKIDLRPQNLDLADVINDAVQTMKPMSDESNHEVVLSVPDDLPEAYADAGKVKQVLLNFLSNAVKFTPAGGRITVEATARDGFCQVSVIDTGIGIKEEDQVRVFEVFVQGEALPENTRKGTGLGLALARQFVNLMGGRIWVESKHGKGSKFSFTIPRASDEELHPGDTGEAEGKPSVVAESFTSPHRKEVLIVDDDRKARGILRAWLEQEGYIVYEATNAEGAILGARKLQPAVIVLDILMPGKDGWQVLSELKSIPETRDIPVVITSMLTEKELGFSLGAADYFTKPVDKERFLTRLVELGVSMDKTILVVDDNQADAHLVMSILKSDHIDSVCAYNGSDGMRMAMETEPDLIVLDLIMPDMNGFEFVDELRRQENGKDIPIIILTASDLVDGELEGLRQKTTAVIRKSVFTRESFLSEVRKVIDNGGKQV